MVDKRNKMIDNNKMVFECIICRRLFPGALPAPKECPNCHRENTMVINNQYIVTKGV